MHKYYYIRIYIYIYRSAHEWHPAASPMQAHAQPLASIPGSIAEIHRPPKKTPESGVEEIGEMYVLRSAFIISHREISN